MVNYNQCDDVLDHQAQSDHYVDKMDNITLMKIIKTIYSVLRLIAAQNYMRNRQTDARHPECSNSIGVGTLKIIMIEIWRQN